MSTLEDVEPVAVSSAQSEAAPTSVPCGGTRWWRFPTVTSIFLTVVVVYLVWAIFQNAYYYVGIALAPGPDLSVLLAVPHRQLRRRQHAAPSSCFIGGPSPRPWSPVALPGGFRFTCYYYRKAYYRSFWQAPPACGVADGHAIYTGETRFPLILQNLHRYFWFIGTALHHHPHHRRRDGLPASR